MTDFFKNLFTEITTFLMEYPLVWVSCIVSFALSALLIPLVIHLCNKYHWYDSIDARKIHTGNIPRLGSVGFVTAFSVVTLIYVFISRDNSLSMISFVVAGFLIFLFGIIDDFLNLRALYKLLVQIVAALIVVCSGFRFRQIWTWVIPVPLSYVLTFVWIIGIVNAYNLIDGVDALCGSLSGIVIFTIGLIYAHNAVHSAAACFILVAAILGFLLYNKPKAKIFMGDGGSQFLGFMIATLPLYETTVLFEQSKFLIMLNLVSIPAVDCIAAIWRRTREHRNIMSPDRFHLHHKLMNQGFSAVQILILLDGIQIALCLLVGIALNTRGITPLLLLIFGLVAISIFFSIIHFENKAWKNEHNSEN